MLQCLCNNLLHYVKGDKIMAIRYEQFIHPNDVKAQHSLELIPGFKKLVKEFMNIVGEKTFLIENMSGKIKLGKNQMPEIYNLLIPICEKLGIDIPELYLELDRNPNAYTFGDTEVAIVLTSGLIETLSKEEIQVVIAHECGHILCHHTLYKTMARLIMQTGSYFLNGIIGGLINISLTAALCYWDRCSEFSADRVSAYYVGSSDLVSDVMMRLAGGTNNLGLSLNKEAFLRQASEYKEYMDSSKLNKGIEILMYAFNDHPLLAYRAFEVTEWCNSEDFYNIDPTIVVDVPNNSAKLNIEQYVVDKVESKHIINWFKENNSNNTYKNLVVHCGICSKDLKYLKKLSFNSSKTIYQALVDTNDNVIKYRLILFSYIDEGLKELFIKNDGYIIIK